MKDKCKNCGGWKGLHHYKTDQCPIGGVESQLNRPQEWKDTTYEEENDLEADNAALRQQNAELISALVTMTGLAFIKYGNLDADVYAEIQKAQGIIAKAKASQ